MFNGTVPFSINTADDLAGAYLDANGVLHAFVFTTGGQAATPTFSPAAGTYTTAQTVTISDTTAGAAIFYTTDGSTPSTSSTPYTGPITVSSTETIQAVALASGCSSSAVASAKYTINPPPDFQVTVNPTSLTIVAGHSGTATFTVTPINGFNSQVSFVCSGLPSEAACSFNPASVTPNGAAVSSTLTVTTTAKSAAARKPLGLWQGPIYALLFPILAIFVFRRGKRPDACLPGLLLSLLLLAMTACGGNSGGNNNTGNPGTPPGTSSVSVAASTSGSGGTNHAATLTIIVTQ
jgi:hypothetical protein